MYKRALNTELGRGLPLSPKTHFKPERVPLELDDVATVGEAVQQRRGEPLLRECQSLAEGGWPGVTADSLGLMISGCGQRLRPLLLAESINVKWRNIRRAKSDMEFRPFG